MICFQSGKPLRRIDCMATPGEIAWAGLIASKTTIHDISTLGGRYAWNFKFVNGIEHRTNWYDISMSIHSRGYIFYPLARGPVGVTLVLEYRRSWLSSWEVAYFPARWAHYWDLPRYDGDPLRLVYPADGKISLTVLALENVSIKSGAPFVLSQGERYTLTLVDHSLLQSSGITPLSLIGLSLRRRAIASPRWNPKMPNEKERRHGLTPKENPQRINTSFTRAQEYSQTDYQPIGDSYESYYRGYSSVNTPGFFSKKRKQLPVNPFSCEIVKTYDGQACDIRKRLAQPSYVNNGYGKTSSLFSVGAQNPSFITGVEGLANRRLISDSGQAIEGNLAQDIAQYGQLVNLIGGNATKIANSIYALRARDFRRAINELTVDSRAVGNYHIRKGKPSVTKTLAQNWLELQYGWKPLLQDIHGTADSLARAVHTNSQVYTARGSANVEQSSSGVIIGPDGVAKAGTFNTRTLQSARFGIRYKVDDAWLAFAQQTGFTNPVNLIWEVLPYSFVVDWFLPIGPYLEGLTAGQGLTVIDGYKTLFLRQIHSATVSFDGYFEPYNPNEKSYWIARGKFQREWIKVSRVPLYAFPTAPLPSFKNPLSVTHALNALALLRSAFK